MERETDVGEGGLHSLKCELIARAMDKHHARMLKNLQKLEDFTLKSRMVAGRSMSSIRHEDEQEREQSRGVELFDPVEEAKVEETERTPKVETSLLPRLNMPIQ